MRKFVVIWMKKAHQNAVGSFVLEAETYADALINAGCKLKRLSDVDAKIVTIEEVQQQPGVAIEE
jgi:hypothetical protein